MSLVTTVDQRNVGFHTFGLAATVNRLDTRQQNVNASYYVRPEGRFLISWGTDAAAVQHLGPPRHSARLPYLSRHPRRHDAEHLRQFSPICLRLRLPATAGLQRPEERDRLSATILGNRGWHQLVQAVRLYVVLRFRWRRELQSGSEPRPRDRPRTPGERDPHLPRFRAPAHCQHLPA